jgi:hypothetical protein
VIRKALASLRLLAAAVALSGCFTTTIQSGYVPGHAPLEARERWHSGFVLGIAEASGPYDLERICPNGWAEVKTETSFFNGVVELITSGVYNPQTVTVRCAAEIEPPHGYTSVPPPPPMPPPPPAPVAPPPSAPPPASP